MTVLGFDLVSHGVLSRVSAAFAGGMHVLLGAEADGAGAFVELAAGTEQARVGHVVIDGKEPFSHAEVRRRVAALCAEERLPPARDVTGALGLALRARGDARSALSVLDLAGLSHFAARRAASLSPREVRALGLVLALTHPEPLLVALFEPLALLDLISAALVLDTLADLADSGAVVLCTASRLEDAVPLGGAVSSLERGTWLDPAILRVAPTQITLRVLTSEAERLAAQLSAAPDVVTVEWAGGDELFVRGSDLERTAAHVASSARSAAIPLEALRYEQPSLYALAAARSATAAPAEEPR